MSIDSISGFGGSYSYSYSSQDSSGLSSSSSSGDSSSGLTSGSSLSDEASIGILTGATDKQSLGAQLITKSLDYMHSGGLGSSSKDDKGLGFQMDVLGSMGARKGIITNSLV